VKTILTACFDAKGIIHHEFVPQKQTVNGKFYKEAIKGLIARVRVRPSFREIGPWYVLRDNAPTHSSGVVSEFLTKRGISVLFHPLYSTNLTPADFFIPYIKNCNERDWIRGCFIDRTDCDERIEGDMRRSVFSVIRFLVSAV
jgi:hypothetical protein